MMKLRLIQTLISKFNLVRSASLSSKALIFSSCSIILASKASFFKSTSFNVFTIFQKLQIKNNNENENENCNLRTNTDDEQKRKKKKVFLFKIYISITT